MPDPEPDKPRWKISKIPKKTKGKFRTIYILDRELRQENRRLLGQLNMRARKLCPEGVVHGFMRRKSVVTSAQLHVGHRYTLCFDLEDFFDSVTERQLKGKISDELLKQVLFDGAARQGPPSSPAVANIAASDMDHAILNYLKKHELNVVYTRYADDLSFSFDDYEIYEKLRQRIPEIVGTNGFKINRKKTRLQPASRGRRRLCGVMVDDTKIYPTRQVRRRLRAAIHQKHMDEAHGLAEWCRLKPPRQPKKTGFTSLGDFDSIEEELASVLKAGKVKYPNRKKPLPEKAQDVVEVLEDGRTLTITGDPVYMAGMSTYTKGWKSCMSLVNRGSYSKGVGFWIRARHARLGLLLHPTEEIEFGRVCRKEILARAIIHDMSDGQSYYDRFYGGEAAVNELRTWLEARGIFSVAKSGNAVSAFPVPGDGDGCAYPYFDSMRLVDRGEHKYLRKR
jgi:hypothetical protein